ncbi:MAG TPA: GrpB family protein [Pirellulaceae bacterium]|nr:GrpB family protein [Pirellulaceae bacterium]
MPSRYSFEPYSPNWPRLFEQEAARLRELLGAEFVAIHHIGSTAVPGLAAKPIIDLLPMVRQIERVDLLTPAFEAAGYRAWGEYGLPGRRYFTKDDATGLRTHNVHVYGEHNSEIGRHLAFRDYLRASPDLRGEYEELKRRAYALHPADIERYNDAKDAWIKRVERKAIESCHRWAAREEQEVE